MRNLTLITILLSICSFVIQEKSSIGTKQDTWNQYLKAAFEGSHDHRINKNTKISSKSGACKITFMNIQYRMNKETINPNDKNTQAIALDMSEMKNAFHKNSKVSNYELISPTYKGKSISLKDYKSIKYRDSISSNVTQHILDLTASDTSNYYSFGFGIATGYHLLHLFVDTSEDTVRWYLFDDFGIGGNFVKFNNTNLQNFSMNQSEVEHYLNKYIKTAAKTYLSSKNINNPAIVYNQKWKAGNRPLYTIFYTLN